MGGFRNTEHMSPVVDTVCYNFWILHGIVIKYTFLDILMTQMHFVTGWGQVTLMKREKDQRSNGHQMNQEVILLHLKTL